MKIINLDRGHGKTSLLVAWFTESPTTRVVVCPNWQAATRFRELAVARGVSGRLAADRVTSMNRAADIRFLRGFPADTEVAVDDLDIALIDLFGTMRIDVATISEPVELVTVDETEAGTLR
jgi:hypothetical protein